MSETQQNNIFLSNYFLILHYLTEEARLTNVSVLHCSFHYFPVSHCLFNH